MNIYFCSLAAFTGLEVDPRWSSWVGLETKRRWWVLPPQWPVQIKSRFFWSYFFLLNLVRPSITSAFHSQHTINSNSIISLPFTVSYIHSKTQLDIAELEIPSCMADHCVIQLLPLMRCCVCEPGRVYCGIRTQRQSCCKKAYTADPDMGRYPPGSLLWPKWDRDDVLEASFSLLLRGQLLLITTIIQPVPIDRLILFILILQYCFQHLSPWVELALQVLKWGSTCSLGLYSYYNLVMTVLFLWLCLLLLISDFFLWSW